MAFLKNKSVIIYGLGQDYEERKSFYEEEFNIVGYSDKRTFEYDHFIPATELHSAKFDYIFITSRKYYREIKDMLLGQGIAEDKIISEALLIYMLLEKSRYDKQEPQPYPYYHFSLGQEFVNISIHQNNIYEPIYPNSQAQYLMPRTGPEIYNRDGQRVETFFIRDNDLAGYNYKSGKYFMWDYYNWRLDTHFYFNYHMLEQIGSPMRKYAFLSEPKVIYPDLYENVLNHMEAYREFDAFFTSDAEILDKFPNAKFDCRTPGNRYGMGTDNAKEIEDNYKNKRKSVSMIASAKEITPLHVLRKETAIKCKKSGLADTYGAFDGGREFEDYDEPFREYRYQIVVENSVSPYYFTEKITSCIASQTIPIYVGASNIGKFYNMDGIISIDVKDLEHIEEVLKQCTEREYERRLPAVLDNYYRLRDKYNWFSWDYFYEQYFMNK